MPEGVEVPTSEHGYQADKFDDPQARAYVLAAPSGYAAKNRAKEMERKGALKRPDWVDRKVEVMAGYVRQKFMRNPDIAVELINTGSEELIEGNDRGDTFWGVCPPESDNGQNWLGRILMETRQIIQIKGAPHEGPTEIAS